MQLHPKELNSFESETWFQYLLLQRLVCGPKLATYSVNRRSKAFRSEENRAPQGEILSKYLDKERMLSHRPSVTFSWGTWDDQGDPATSIALQVSWACTMEQLTLRRAQALSRTCYIKMVSYWRQAGFKWEKMNFWRCFNGFKLIN